MKALWIMDAIYSISIWMRMAGINVSEPMTATEWTQYILELIRDGRIPDNGGQVLRNIMPGTTSRALKLFAAQNPELMDRSKLNDRNVYTLYSALTEGS